mmetsp:Transcript_21653/g.60184  ORF Transcript_21653/g.60184 Transcript_21653/m.60184 type:complete len:843 (-) Transcript_21653:191-2719(-)
MGGDGSHQLTAVSDIARSCRLTQGSCDFVLQQPLTKVGRKVAANEGMCLPSGWIRVSSNHCRIQWDKDAGHYLVTDTSSNGTFINGARIKKGGSLPFVLGDVLRLSLSVNNNAKELIEYKLEEAKIRAPNLGSQGESNPDKESNLDKENDLQQRTGNASTTPYTGVTEEEANDARAVKRKWASIENGEDIAALLQMQKANKELIKKLEAARQQLAAVETRTGEEITCLKEELHQAREEVGRAAEQEKQRAQEAAQSTIESLKAALQTAKARANDLESQRAEEATARGAAEAALTQAQAAQEHAQQAIARAEKELLDAWQQMEQLQQEKARAEAGLREANDELHVMKASMAAATAKQADLLQQLELERSQANHAGNQLQIAHNDLKEQQESTAAEAKLRQDAEAAVATLQRKLYEAMVQNERAEEGHQAALGTSAVQRAYLMQVLDISRHLRDSREAEEAARASAQKARAEADQCLQRLQVHVVSALHPELESSQLSLEEMQEVACSIPANTPASGVPERKPFVVAASGAELAPSYEEATRDAVEPTLAIDGQATQVDGYEEGYLLQLDGGVNRVETSTPLISEDTTTTEGEGGHAEEVEGKVPEPTRVIEGVIEAGDEKDPGEQAQGTVDVMVVDKEAEEKEEDDQKGYENEQKEEGEPDENPVSRAEEQCQEGAEEQGGGPAPHLEASASVEAEVRETPADYVPVLTVEPSPVAMWPDGAAELDCGDVVAGLEDRPREVGGRSDGRDQLEEGHAEGCEGQSEVQEEDEMEGGDGDNSSDDFEFRESNDDLKQDQRGAVGGAGEEEDNCSEIDLTGNNSPAQAGGGATAGGNNDNEDTCMYG